MAEELAEGNADVKEKEAEEAAGGDESDGAEADEKKPREIKPFHVVDVDKAVRGIDFTEDGKRFVVACSDGSLRLYGM